MKLEEYITECYHNLVNSAFKSEVIGFTSDITIPVSDHKLHMSVSRVSWDTTPTKVKLVNDIGDLVYKMDINVVLSGDRTTDKTLKFPRSLDWHLLKLFQVLEKEVKCYKLEDVIKREFRDMCTDFLNSVRHGKPTLLNATLTSYNVPMNMIDVELTFNPVADWGYIRLYVNKKPLSGKVDLIPISLVTYDVEKLEYVIGEFLKRSMTDIMSRYPEHAQDTKFFD